MSRLSVTKLAAATALALSGAAANALTFDGVDFTSSFAANVLTIGIDAAGKTGGWANAMSIDTIGIKDVGSFSSVAIGGSGAGWAFSSNELNANGCAGGDSGGACFFGTPVSLLGGPLSFTFTFAGGPLDLSNPHLKVRFLDGDGNKVGSLLSVNVPAVPEPETYALMLAGLGVVGLMARRRKKDAQQ